MKGQMVVETTVKVAAEEFWDAYRDIKRVRILHELLGEMVGEPRVEHGDGGVGTIVSIANPPEAFWGKSDTKELYRMIDDEKRITEVEIIEGGLKDLGFDYLLTRAEIIEKDPRTMTVNLMLQFNLLFYSEN
ncbi:hypothetical protein CUMW_215740 [Citrus unshiu]|uniref:Bet v I/Major latex protein domain-containing protein n=1 Tax=Citrus unshiu TaxID=55188 RepID=A0A2H5QC10_CITUN|nr:hypothetical protein CUMW_215740 [Citrus unshiu]